MNRIKQSVYLGEALREALHVEAIRLDRTVPWLVVRCVAIGLPAIRELPSVPSASSRDEAEAAQ